MFRIKIIIMVRTIAFLLTLVVLLKLLKLFLPPPLQYADTYHLVRLVIDSQSFPMDDVDIVRDNTTIPIQIDEETINNYLQKMAHIPDQKKYNDDSVLKHFMPVLSLTDKATLLITFETFVGICRLANLTYFLYTGSLLGVYRHHGIIPWDDDIDVVMNASDWRRIQNALSRVEGYELLAPGKQHWKFFKKDLPFAPGQSFKWPFIDIFFYTEDSTYMWALSGELKRDFVQRKDDIFPLQLRQFEHMRVVVPCAMEQIIQRQFAIQDCHSPTGSHKEDLAFNSSRIKRIPCKQLYNIFPFVFRQKDTYSGIAIETLKVGDTVLRKFQYQNLVC